AVTGRCRRWSVVHHNSIRKRESVYYQTPYLLRKTGIYSKGRNDRTILPKRALGDNIRQPPAFYPCTPTRKQKKNHPSGKAGKSQIRLRKYQRTLRLITTASL